MRRHVGPRVATVQGTYRRQLDGDVLAPTRLVDELEEDPPERRVEPQTEQEPGTRRVVRYRTDVRAQAWNDD